MFQKTLKFEIWKKLNQENSENIQDREIEIFQIKKVPEKSNNIKIKSKKLPKISKIENKNISNQKSSRKI